MAFAILKPISFYAAQVYEKSFGYKQLSITGVGLR